MHKDECVSNNCVCVCFVVFWVSASFSMLFFQIEREKRRVEKTKYIEKKAVIEMKKSRRETRSSMQTKKKHV